MPNQARLIEEIKTWNFQTIANYLSESITPIRTWDYFVKHAKLCPKCLACLIRLNALGFHPPNANVSIREVIKQLEERAK